MSKAAMIYPGEISEEFKAELADSNIVFYNADLQECVAIARQCEKDGVDVIISRAGLEAAIKKIVNVPVVNCELTHADIVDNMLRIKKECGPSLKKIGLFNYASVTYNVQYFKETTGLNVRQFWYWDNADNLRKGLIECKKAGIDVVLGANMTMKFSWELGMRGYLKQLSSESLHQAVQKAREIIEIRRRDREYGEKIKNILSFAREGILFVSEKDKIEYANPRARKILLDARADILEGADVADVIPGWANKIEGVFLDQIAKTANAQIIYNRVPIHAGGAYSGSVVTFSETALIQRVEEKIRKFFLKKGFVARHSLDDIAGASREIRQAVRQAGIFAQTDATVLITGETGTGKELFAHGIHQASMRKEQPFLAINCAALPENLLESELFGYEEGAFTGARRGGRAGYFELAHRGTLFLDEIGELKLTLQGKLLRAICGKEIMRIGGNRIIPVDVRIIAATNSDLPQAVARKEFRSDLYYRLNILNVDIPPLRARDGDIALLAGYFADKYCRENKLPALPVTEELLRSLQAHDWPGNVRELECFIFRYCILASSGEYNTVKAVSPLKAAEKDCSPENDDSRKLRINIGTLAQMNDEIYTEIYRLTGENKTQTAKVLGLNRMTIYKWLAGHRK